MYSMRITAVSLNELKTLTLACNWTFMNRSGPKWNNDTSALYILILIHVILTFIKVTVMRESKIFYAIISQSS